MGLSNMQKKVSGFLVTALIGLIIVSFLFQSYQSRRGSVDTIAKVGDTTISVSDFQTAYGRQIDMYSKFMGGKDLTTAQIKQFGIKRQVMSGLISRALMMNLGEELGYTPAKTQVAKTIQDIKVFKVGEQFNFDRYKSVLKANRHTPATYEKLVETELLQTGVESLVKSFPLSDQYVDDLNRFKTQKANATVISFTKEGLKPSLEINKDEINSFLSDKNSLEKAKNIFIDRKLEFTKKESVKARHILLRIKSNDNELILRKITKLRKKLTPKNFARMASKYTEDPSGKGKGGNLPPFSRGSMAPEFEKEAFSMKTGSISAPIKTSFGYHIIYKEKHNTAVTPTFDKYKDLIVKDYLRNQKKDELELLAKTVTDKIEGLLKKGQISKIEKLKSKYNLTIAKDQKINRLDGIKDVTSLTPENIKKLFDLTINKSSTIASSDNGKVTIIKTVPFIKNKKEKEESFEKEGQELIMARKVRGQILEKLKDSFSIKDYGVI